MPSRTNWGIHVEAGYDDVVAAALAVALRACAICVGSSAKLSYVTLIPYLSSNFVTVSSPM